MATSITLRATKGSPLTHAEVDQNFLNLQETADAAADAVAAIGGKANASAIGISDSASNLGTFTGSTISSNTNVKTALQELETAVEAASGPAATKAEASALGVAASALNLGTFTGTTIPDNQTAKQALQALETSHETHVDLLNNTVSPQSSAAYNKLLKRKYLIDDYIPSSLWAGIRNGTNTMPLDSYLALAAADLDGTKLIISEGTFLHAATWDLKGRTAFEIEGGNPQAVLFKPSFLTGDVIDVGSASAGALSGAHIHGIGVNSTTARTSGSFIRARNITSFHFENFWLAGQANGVEIGAGVVKSTVGGAGIARIINPTATTGLAVLVTGGTLITLQNLLIEGNQTTQALGAIKLTNVSDIGIKDCSATYSRDAFILEPGVGETVEQVWTRDNTWDSGSGSGMVFRGSGTIRVFTSTDDWSATNGARGVWLQTGPTIQDVRFKGLESYNNAQEGVLAEKCGGWFSISDATVAGNSTSLANANDGVRIIPGASAVERFRISGVRSGVTGQFTNVQRYGIRVDAGTATTYSIQGCDTDGNGTGGLSDAGTASIAKSVTANVP